MMVLPGRQHGYDSRQQHNNTSKPKLQALPNHSIAENAFCVISEV
jgi:hypothetical protein